MIIYMDIVLIENLIMNFIILYATGIVIKIKIKIVRLLIASLLGAIYSVVAYMDIFPIYSSMILKIILSIVIVYVSFNAKKIKKLIKDILVFYLVSFVFGGAAFCFIYLIKPQEILMKNGLFMGIYTLKTIILASIISFIIIILVFKIVKSKITKGDMFCEIEININDKKIITNAMIDTGNLLKDPISGLPVIVIEKSLLYNYMPKKLLDNINDLLAGDISKFNDEIIEEYFSKIKLIPFSSVGKQNGMLVGFKIEEVIIKKEDQEINKIDAIMGIYDKSLTKKGEYRALIGLEFL